jgi:RHS repeat-associated protein
LGNGLVEARSYDTYRQQLTGVSLGPNGSILNLGFDYCTNTPPQTSCTNNNGNLQSQTIWPLGVAQTYTYDSYNRLYTSGEKAGTTTTWSEDFNYDSFGNRWVPSSFMGLPNPVGIPVSPWTVQANYYNSATNRLTYNNFGYDNGGNQTTISPYTVSYDVENRQSGFTSTSNGSATYTYDGDGRRVEKTAGGVTTTYVYDATGNLAAEYSSQPPSMPCQTCYLTSDHLGSTRVITGQTGGLVSRHDFLPFGEELATGNRTAAQGYGVADNVMQRYTGKQRDLEGPVLDFFGARYFQGAQGRFTSPDWSSAPQPVPYADLTDPQTLDLYSYVRNNPLSKTDLDGHCGLIGSGPCSLSEFIASVPDRIVGGLKFEANAALEMLGATPKFQPSNTEQADAMAAGEQIKPVFQQGLAMAIPGPKGEALPDEAVVVRGGLNKPENFEKGSGVTIDANGNLQGVSVNSAAGKSEVDLSQGIQNNKVGVTTVGAVRDAGGNVTPDPTKGNPYHCQMCGVSAKKASDLMTVKPNPAKQPNQ